MTSNSYYYRKRKSNGIKPITIRLTELEKQILDNLVKHSGLSQQKFLVNTILEKSIAKVNNDRQSIA